MWKPYGHNIKHFVKNISTKGTSEAYSEPNQTPKILRFAKINVWLNSEHASGQNFLPTRLKFPKLDPSFIWKKNQVYNDQSKAKSVWTH